MTPNTGIVVSSDYYSIPRKISGSTLPLVSVILRMGNTHLQISASPTPPSSERELRCASSSCAAMLIGRNSAGLHSYPARVSSVTLPASHTEQSASSASDRHGGVLLLPEGWNQWVLGVHLHPPFASGTGVYSDCVPSKVSIEWHSKRPLSSTFITDVNLCCLLILAARRAPCLGEYPGDAANSHVPHRESLRSALHTALNSS